MPVLSKLVQHCLKACVVGARRMDQLRPIKQKDPTMHEQLRKERKPNLEGWKVALPYAGDVQYRQYDSICIAVCLYG